MQAEKYDLDKGMQAVFDQYDWLNKNFPMYPEAPSSHVWFRLINSGVLYVCKRDKMGRPVTIMNVEKITKVICEIDDLISMCNYFFTFVVEKLMVPGLVETWIHVVDLKNVGVSSIPLAKVKAIIASGSKYFRGKMHRQYTINASWIVRKGFGAVTSFLDEF